MQFAPILFFIGMVLEFSTLFWVFQWLGGWGGLGLMLLGVVLGGLLIKNNIHLTKTLQMQQFLRKGSASLYDMFLPIRIPIAGILLALPTGFLSSVLGLLLLIPFHIGKRISDPAPTPDFRQHGFRTQTQKPKHDNIIEGEYTVKKK